jgi:2-keto-4-pentenoate hydratase/2-oxohepta-3-ene-1,7-dioic acid hydratase in catechol pathway
LIRARTCGAQTLAAFASVSIFLLLGFGCDPEAVPAPTGRLGPGQLARVEIADPEEALTFARFDSSGERRAIAVTRYEGGNAEGLDLSLLLGHDVPDPIAALRDAGYDALRQAIRAAPPAARVVVPARELISPVDLGDHHAAAGTNFPEHAGEADVEDGPFLFAKLVAPTGPYAPVSAGNALLDYEAELAWVTLEPLRAGERPGLMGLILCNDYTDRDILLHHVDAGDVESGKGFATGKSLPGYLPVGNLLVIPRDHRKFAASRELRLYVNDVLRQRSRVNAQVWDIDEMIAQIFARREQRWDHRGKRVSLPGADGIIPARTLLMSGTPAGTVFQGIDLEPRLSGLGSWLLGGWKKPLVLHVIDAYVSDARAKGIYLRPGDRVVIHVDTMGVIQNTIVP